MGYSSEREEGEISVLKGKEKLYVSDTGQGSTSEKAFIVSKKVVRKSNRVRTHSRKLDL